MTLKRPMEEANFYLHAPRLSLSRMPTYEYRCAEGHDFERFYRKISDAPSDVTCPVCGKVAERIMSAGAGLVFKGSGFYLTDYGKNAHRGGGPEAKGEKTEAKSESKEGGAKPAEGRSSEGKSSEGKSAEGKSAESKPAEAKPAAKEPTTKPSSGKSDA